jgi:prepilin-type N-terminal cleavage/methylation domain-containing protein
VVATWVVTVIDQDTGWSRSRFGASGNGGFALLEVIVATAIAGLVLSAAYSWLWNVAALAVGTDDDVQAATVAGAVGRALAADVRAAIGVTVPPAGRDPARSLALVHDHVDVAREAVLIVWDPVRGVVWRNASGTYLADHVTRFEVAYALADGRHVTGGSMMAQDWTAVRGVSVELTVIVGSAVAARVVEATVGPA